jgi:predicted outer membrane repeat protein
VIYPAIRGINSTFNLSLTGYVHIFNNHVVGAVIFLAQTTDSKDVGTSDRNHSTLNVNNGVFVHFINNTAKCGGAIYVRNTAINVGYKVKINRFEINHLAIYRIKNL